MATEQHPTDEWIRVKDAAERIGGISPRTLRGHLVSGEIPVRAILVTPRTIRVHRQSLEEWLASRTLNAVS